jgi:iron-sulfur cluster assembly protein
MSHTEIAPPRKRALPPLMTLTDAAAQRLRTLYAGGQNGKLLRVALSTKGCSGLSYDMSWVDAPGPGDEIVTDRGVTVLVDRKATLFLIGTTMDFEQTTLSSSFMFVNPNEKGRCGCGESFHV